MNENQLRELYDRLSARDNTYSKRYSFDQFKNNMQDDAYVSKLNDWMSRHNMSMDSAQEPSVQQPPVQQQPTSQQPVANAYNAADLLKKKSIQSVSSSDQSLSEQPTEGDGAAAMKEALTYKPQPLPSEGTRAGMPAFEKKQYLQERTLQEEQKKKEIGQQTPDFLKKQLDSVNKDLLEGKSEEYVAPDLNYRFGPLGFKFEESGGNNEISITAPNGKKTSVPLVYKGGELASSLIKKFVSENAVDIKDLNKLSEKYKGSQEKFATEKQLEEVTKSTSEEFSSIAKKIKEYTVMSESVDKMFQMLDEVPFDQRNTQEYKNNYKVAIEKKQELLNNAPKLEEERQRINQKYKDVEKAAGDYFMMKGQQGTWSGALGKGMYKGIGSFLAGVNDLGMLAAGPTLNQMPAMQANRDEMRKAITNYFVDEFGDKSTTEQWEAAHSQSTAGKAILGLGSMVPAIVAGAVAGPAASAAVFGAQGYNDAMIEAADAGVPPGERELVAVPIGITMAAIGELGLSKIPGAKNLANTITAKALGSLGSDFTASEFKNFVSNEVKSAVARGAITAGKGFVHGFETGVKMELATEGIKDVYNLIKDKRDENDKYMKVFNTPNSIGEYFSSAIEGGLSMAIGGAILTSPEVFKVAREKNNYNGISDKDLAFFDILSKDDNGLTFITLDIKKQILDGKITKEQGEAQIDSYNKSVSLMKSLPEGLTNAQKRKALGLLQEKMVLKSQIEGKDPSLTKKQSGRIAEIDDFLGKISEGAYAETAPISIEEVEVKPGETVQWHTDVTKPLEDWVVSEIKDDSAILTKGEESQTIPLNELKQHLIDNNAVQKPTTNESVLRAEQPELELPKVGEGNKELEIIKDEEEGPIEEGIKSNMSENQNETKIELPNIIESSQTGLNHANSIGGTAYQIEGGIGIVQGFNLFGEPIYLAYKEGVGRTNTDIESYKGDAFSQEELTKLKELKNDLVNKEKENQANSEDPFDKQGRVASTDNVSKNAKDFIKNITDKLGLNKKIFIITDADFNEVQYKKHGLYGSLSPVRSAKLSSENKLEFGHKRYMPEAEAYYIYYDGKLNESQLFTILSHELGHIIEQDKFKNASEETKNAIKQDWANWYSKLTGKTVSEVINETRDITIQDLFAKNTTEYNPSLHKYISSFSEYFADNVSKWARSSEKPKTLVDKFFHELSESFKKIVDYVFKTGNYSKNIFSWLDEMYESNGKENVSEEKVKQTAKQELGSLMAESISKRKELKSKGLSESEISKHPDVVSLSEKINDAIKRTKEEESTKLVEPMKSEDLSNLPEYESTMRRVQDFADFSTRNKEYWEGQLKQAQKSGNKEREKESREELKKYTEGNLDKAIEILEKSETYKSASDVQREALIRDMRKRFELKEKKAPKPEELFGDVVEVNKLMEEIKFQFEDAEKSKSYLEEKYEKAREAYKKSVEEGRPSAKLKENMERAKAEVEEYRTKNIEDAKKALRDSEPYKKATEEQQQKMEKYLEDRFLKRKEVLPTKLFEAEDNKSITKTEKKSWSDQLKAFVRGIKDQAKFVDSIRKEIKDRLDGLAKGGKISASQVDTIIKKISSLRFNSEKSIDKFVDYVSKVFADAEYGSKLNKANELRGNISRLSRAEKNPANLKVMAQEFNKIDPSMVEDIDKYNETANKIKEAMRGGKSIEMVSTEEIGTYTKEALKNQKEQIQAEMAEKIKELFLFDPTGMTDEQMAEMLRKEKKKSTPEEIAKRREEAQREFDSYATLIKEMLRTGKDPFTGEPIDTGLDSRGKDIVERFLEMDTKRLTDKEMLDAIQVITNFATNFSLAKMEKIVEIYEAPIKLEELANKGIIAEKLRSYYSGAIGRLKFGYRANIPAYFERLFKGVTRSLKAREAIGLNNLINQVTKAKYLANKASIDYANEFIKDNKEFNTVDNATQRGMLAHLMRSVSGTPEEIAKDFERRKAVIKEAIESLSKGSKKEIEKSEIYQKAWDELDIENAKSADDVIAKSDKENVRAVKWWIDKWAENRKIMSDVSEGIYNRVLENDNNFTPDRYSRFEDGPVDLLKDEESVFHGNNGTLYDTESGSLMEARRPDADEIKTARRYIDLSFDAINATSFYDAMVDVHTAASIQRVMAAINSDAFKKIIKDENDRRLTQNVIKKYVSDFRNKSSYESSEVADAVRKFNKIADMGVTMALGGVLQPVKQTVSVAANAIATGSIPQIFDMYKNGGIDFIMNSGMGIALRSRESQTNINSINKIIDLVAQSKGSKYIEALGKANEKLMKLFLEKPDVWIARASWLGYYEKYLKDNGKEYKDIDYTKHKMNQEAANYAQAMLDKQQNISDRDLNGMMFKSRKPTAQLIMKAVMPFANFRLNQATRISNDIAVLNSKVSTIEDRKIAARSLAGTSVEMAVFNLAALGIAYGIGSMTKAIMGQEETEEESSKRFNNLVKGKVTGLVTDVFSPLPITDAPVQSIAHGGIDLAQDIAQMNEDDRVNIFEGKKSDFIKDWGLLGIPVDRLGNLYDVSKMYATGEFKDEYGRAKILSEDDREAMGMMITPAFLSVAGLAPTEVSTIVKQSIKFAEKKAKVESKLTPQEQKEREQNKADRLENKEDKIDAINVLIEQQNDPEVVKELQKIKKDLNEKPSKEEKRKEKEKMEELLQGYESKSDMKRYDPALYERTFGEGTKYYMENRAEIEAEKKLREYMREQKDIEYNYTPKPKKRRLQFDRKLILRFRRRGQ